MRVAKSQKRGRNGRESTPRQGGVLQWVKVHIQENGKPKIKRRELLGKASEKYTLGPILEKAEDGGGPGSDGAEQGTIG